MLLKTDERLLLVGGACRNVGKTEFACRIIRAHSSDYPIYGLKVSAVLPDEEMYHGEHFETSAAGLYEETRMDSAKDTSRMLRAGACRVFYLRCGEDSVLEGYRRFCRMVPENSLVVCESNSLADFLRPGVHIMIRHSDKPVKLRALPQLERADLVVVSDGSSGFADIERISVAGNTWILLDSPAGTV